MCADTFVKGDTLTVPSPPPAGHGNLARHGIGARPKRLGAAALPSEPLRCPYLGSSKI